jgi:hypothetical protein
MSKKIERQKSSEKNSLIRKILGIISLIIIVSNIFLRFAFRIYDDTIFWIIIVIVAIIAWPVMNYLKK